MSIMKLKVTTVGNSTGVILPKELLEKLRISKGDSLYSLNGYGIAKNHPFVDGNKRTSYVVMRTFLRLNNYYIQASATEKIYNMDAF